MTDSKQNREGLILRVLWMALFVLVWRVAELVLLAVVLVQLAYRLFSGRPQVDVMNFGDSLSQYIAQIGRFGSFHSDEKPWPFSDWPTPREPQGEGAEAVRASAEAVAPVAAAASTAATAQAEQTAAPAVEAEAVQPEAEPQAPAAVAETSESEQPVGAGEAKDAVNPDTPAEPKA